MEVDAWTGSGASIPALGEFQKASISPEGRYLFVWGPQSAGMIWDRLARRVLVQFPAQVTLSEILDARLDVAQGRLTWWESDGQMMLWDLVALQSRWAALGIADAEFSRALPRRSPDYGIRELTFQGPEKRLRPSFIRRAEYSASPAPLVDRLDWALSVVPGDADILEGLLKALDSSAPIMEAGAEVRYLSGVTASLLARGHGRGAWREYAERALSSLKDETEFRLYPDAMAHLAALLAQEGLDREVYPWLRRAQDHWTADAERALGPMAETLWMLGRWEALRELLAREAVDYLSEDPIRHGRRPELGVALKVAERALQIHSGEALARDLDWEEALDAWIASDPLLDPRHPLIPGWRQRLRH